MPATVHNLHRETMAAGDVYIGRPGKGVSADVAKWGNPIIKGAPCLACGIIHHLPAETIPCYRKWLFEEIRAKRITVEDLAALDGKRLFCFCRPKPCHGDVLASAAAWAKTRLDGGAEMGGVLGKVRLVDGPAPYGFRRAWFNVLTEEGVVSLCGYVVGDYAIHMESGLLLNKPDWHWSTMAHPDQSTINLTHIPSGILVRRGMTLDTATKLATRLSVDAGGVDALNKADIKRIKSTMDAFDVKAATPARME